MLTKKMIMTLIISNNEVMKVPTAFANWLSPKRGGVNNITTLSPKRGGVNNITLSLTPHSLLAVITWFTWLGHMVRFDLITNLLRVSFTKRANSF